MKKFQNFVNEHMQFLDGKEKKHDTIVINAYAGAGAGKTTACLEICANLKKEGYVAEYVSEYAKDLVWEENFSMLDGTEEHQFQILKEQLRRMDRLYGKVDFIVTDAPILLNQIYNKELTPEYKDMLHQLDRQYSKLNFFVQRDVTAFETEGRLQNLEQSMQKDNEIKNMLIENELHFNSYNHQTLKNFVPDIISFFKDSQAIKNLYDRQRGIDMPKFKRKQKEEWIEKAKELENQCTERVKEVAENFVRNPDTIAEALAFGSKFYQYSVRNTQLIFSQNPSAQYVQSFPAWKKMGYNIKRGEHGMKILVPVKTTLLKLNEDNIVKLSDATSQQKQDYKEGKITGFVSTRFKVGTVFDIAQTNYPPEKYPELFSVGYPSQTHDDIFKGLTDYAEKFVHCSVKTEDLSSMSLRGYYNIRDNEIVINSSLQSTQKLSTMAHELGHAIRHQLPNDLSASRKEFEADAISVMIESGFGLSLTESRKAHLSDHYNNYVNEIKKEVGTDIPDEVLQEKINEVLSSVYGTYNECIEEINACVEQYISKERLLELTKDMKLDENREIENPKELDKENELEHEKQQEKSALEINLEMDEPELEI